MDIVRGAIKFGGFTEVRHLQKFAEICRNLRQRCSGAARCTSGLRSQTAGLPLSVPAVANPNCQPPAACFPGQAASLRDLTNGMFYWKTPLTNRWALICGAHGNHGT